jgi:pSer/pThr/pTyr-binding forkhead associated (FHA) protein/Mg-chelatase subunit ChlD
VVAVSLASLFLALIAFFVFAAEEPFRIRSVSTAQPDEVSVVVELPLGLIPKAADFDLIIDNEVVTNARETRGLELNIMFLVDVSGSMKGSKNDSPLEDAKSALLKFLGNKRPEDRLELTSFADQYAPLSSFDKESIKTLQAVGTKTLLYQALHIALDDAAKNRPKDDPGTRRIFIVISDGKDEGSDVTREDVMAESKAALVPIYTIFRGKTDPPFRAILESLANAAGGDYFFTRNETQLTNALEKIYQLEKNSLLVKFTYQRDSAAGMKENAKIQLRRPDKSALTAEFPEKIPAALFAAPPPQSRIALWQIGLLLALLVSGAAVWIWSRSRSPTVVTDIPRSEEIDTEPPTIPPPPPPRHRETTLIAQYFPLPTAEQPAAILRGISGPVEGRQHAVDKEIFSIGAGAENDLSIGEDEYISGEHAYLRYEKGSLFIFDKVSRNGTFVNDDRVADTGVVLRPGDRIKLGMSTFEIVMPSA